MKKLTFEQKKAKLRRYRGLKAKEKNLKTDLEEFFIRASTAATHITPPDFEAVITAGGKKLSKQQVFAERDSREALIRQQLSTVQAECNKILRAILKIDNLDYQNTVYEYYILGMSLKEIAFSDHISETTAKRWRNKGIEKIKF